MEIPERDEKICIQEFIKFHDLLMKDAPKGYTPWFFPCNEENKNPNPKRIQEIAPSKSLCCNSQWIRRFTEQEKKQIEEAKKEEKETPKIKPKWRCDKCELLKGSWHSQHAQLTREQCIENIKLGYNIGISARTNDALIIIDIDNPDKQEQIIKNTLNATSRKRAGSHSFCWDKDGTAKINLPTEDDGEIRSNNQYVLSCGSYVPFDLTDEKDKKVFEALPEDAKQDKLLGFYTLKDANTPRPISFSEVPKFFQDKQREDIEAEAKIKQREEVREYSNKEGKYTDLFNLKVSDIVGLISPNERQGHPLHESDTDANFSLSPDGNLAHCWRHLVSLNAVQYLCVKSGYANCGDAGTPHKSRGISKIKGDKKALESAYSEAVKLGLIKKADRNSLIKKTEIFKPQGQVQYYLKKQPIFYDENCLWWIWNSENYKWKNTDEVNILNAIEKITGEDIITPKNRVLILNSLKQECRKTIPEEIKPTWIQFKDKIYDIETGEKFDVTPDYFFPNPIMRNVGKSEETPKIDELFKSWVSEEDVNKLYEICAFVIVPKYFIHSFFFLYSPPGFGKSTFLNLLIKFIGVDNVATTTLDRINNNTRFETYNWHKKLLICMSEVNNIYDLKKSSVINSATGEDMLPAEIKGGKTFQYINYGKFVYPTNKLVKIDAEDGFGRRVRKIDFINQYQKERDVLNEIPDYEFDNLARKCLRIAKELWETRQFSGDVGITERMEQYQLDSKSPVERCIDEDYEIANDDEKITFDSFYAKLSIYYKKINKKLPTKIKIGKELRKLGFENRNSSWENKFLEESEKKYITKNTIFGIKLRGGMS